MNYNRGFCNMGCNTNSAVRNGCNNACGYMPPRRNIRGVQCGPDNHHGHNPAQHLAMVYSPYQEWKDIYCAEKALMNGTLFAELDKPFKGYKTGRGCSC